MDHQHLHKKLMQCGAKNRKTLSLLVGLIKEKKKESREIETTKYENYRKQYEELLKFNKESEEQNYRLKKELALVDIEIEELSYRNKLSRSRIKDQNDEYSNIKDETYDIDKQKKKESQLLQEYEQLKEEKNQLEEDISKAQDSFDLRRKAYYEIQEHYHQKRIKKEYLFKLHRQNQQKSQQRTDQLEAELKSLKNQLSQLSMVREKQQKTKRNNKNIQCLNEIRQMVQFHKQTYERQ